MNKQQFLLSKLQNLINWLVENLILSEKSDYILKLKCLQEDNNKLHDYLYLLSNIADDNGDIKDEIIKYYIDNYICVDINIDEFEKFKKYLKFFVLCYREI